MLFMCGLPGGYPDDLIDVDLDALEDPDERRPASRGRDPGLQRRLPRPAAAAEPRPRRPPSSSPCAPCAARPGRTPARSSTAPWPSSRPPRRVHAGGTPLVEPGEDDDAEATRLRASLEDAVAPAAAGPADLLRARARRGVRARRRPARGRHLGRRRLPRRLVPQRRGAPPVPARPDPRGRGPRLARSRPRREPPRDLSDGLFQRSQETTLVTLRLQPQARWVVEYYPVEARPARRPTARSRSTCSWPTSAGCSGC